MMGRQQRTITTLSPGTRYYPTGKIGYALQEQA
jgi:hypothetical protein